MIVKTKFAGNREVRDLYSGINTTPPTWAAISGGNYAGTRVTLPQAFGLPALGAAMRLVAGTVASLRVGVYQGRRGDKREQAGDWRAQLLEEPAVEISTFDWLWDIAMSLEATENALLEKVKLPNGRVVELRPISMDYARIYRDRKSGQKVIEVIQDGHTERYSTDRVLHIRGQTMGAGTLAGVSRIWQHRDPVGAQLAAQRFEGRFFQNDARPGVAFVFPENVRRDQASEWKTAIESEYGGVDNSWKPFVAGGGVTITPIPVSLADAQFVEGRRLSVEECGRIMDVDPALLGSYGDKQIDRGQALNHFLTVQLTPRLRRIERALKADTDLFGGTDLYPAFELNDLSFASPVVRAQVIHEKIQDGTLLPDEARAEEGLPPLPPIPEDWTQAPGQLPQITPVGGAANPVANTDSVEADAQPVREALLELELRMREEQTRVAEANPEVHVHVDIPESIEMRQNQPIVIPAPVVNVAPADVQVDVHVPEQPAPVVNLPEPQVTVNVPEQPPAQVTVDVQPAEVVVMPPDEQAKKLKVERDANGRLSGATIKPEP